MIENKTVVFYTAVNESSRITGGIRRFRELMVSYLDSGFTIHLFSPFYFNINHKNLILYKIKAYNCRLIPNGILNLIGNYCMLRKIRKIPYQGLIVFEISYAIQCCFLGLRDIIVFVRQDLYRYRTFNFPDNIITTIYKGIYRYFVIGTERLVIHKVKKIIVQCNFDKNQLLSRHNSLAKSLLKMKLDVIPNNVNVSWINLPQGDEIGLKNSNFTIGFLGIIDDPRKGLDILLESIQILLKENFNITFRVAGDGNTLLKYKEKYSNYPQIRFVGYQSDINAFIKTCDTIFVPSYEDSFPNVILESLYLEVPVFGSRRGGIPEILVYDELLFNLSINDIVNKIKYIIQVGNLNMFKNLVIKRKKEFSFNWGKKVINTISSKKIGI